MTHLSLLCFKSIARTKSFSITAKELMISQQAVSRFIHQLEDELQYPLFLRNNQTVCLTKAGEQMLQYILTNEQELNKLTQNIRLKRDENTLQIGYSHWIGNIQCLKDAMKQFQVDHPYVQIFNYELNAFELKDFMENNRLDLVVTSRSELSNCITPRSSSHLCEIPLCLCIGTEYANKNNLTSLSDLISHPHLTSFAGENSENEVRRRVLREYAQIDVIPQQIEIYPNIESVMINVYMGNGVTFAIPNEYLIASGKFTFIPLKERTVTVISSIFQKHSKPLTKELKEYLFCNERCQHERKANTMFSNSCRN